MQPELSLPNIFCARGAHITRLQQHILQFLLPKQIKFHFSALRSSSAFDRIKDEESKSTSTTILERLSFDRPPPQNNETNEETNTQPLHCLPACDGMLENFHSSAGTSTCLFIWNCSRFVKQIPVIVCRCQCRMRCSKENMTYP